MCRATQWSFIRNQRAQGCPSPKRRWATCVLGLLLVGGGVGGVGLAQEWTRFRGPNGSGLGVAENLPTSWSESDYLWRVELPGPGHSCPVLWGDRLFLTCGDEESGDRLALAFDAHSGKPLWQERFASQTHRKHALNSLASATPAVDAERLYIAWATPEEYIVQALDHAGRRLWRADLGPYKTGHGFGVSPIVVGELVIVPNEHEGESSLVALNAANGQVRWKVDRDTKTTYTTPCVRVAADGHTEVLFTNWKHGITALDAATGEQRWEKDVFPADPLETAIGSPIVAGGMVFATSGWLGRASHTVAVQLPDQQDKGGDRIEVAEAYRFERGAPLSTTPIVVNDLVFLWADEGIVTCADLKTGKTHWQRRVGGTYYGSPVYAAGHVYCVSADGEAVVLAAEPSYRLAGRVELGAPSNSTPAVAHGRMYLRTVKHLMALGPTK